MRNRSSDAPRKPVSSAGSVMASGLQHRMSDLGSASYATKSLLHASLGRATVTRACGQHGSGRFTRASTDQEWKETKLTMPQHAHLALLRCRSSTIAPSVVVRLAMRIFFCRMQRPRHGDSVLLRDSLRTMGTAFAVVATARTARSGDARVPSSRCSHLRSSQPRIRTRVHRGLLQC